MKSAKVFRHGNSQAVRLPKEFRFDTDEVVIKRSSGGVLLLPKRITYEQVISVVRRFKGRIRRNQPARDQERKWK